MQMCSDELFTRCRELSEKHGLVRHTHLLETVNQKKVRRCGVVKTTVVATMVGRLVDGLVGSSIN
jgi:cytosine/adenosine deaminase-related metal-dependent hydrolase